MLLRSLVTTVAVSAVAASSASAALPTLKPSDVSVTEGDAGTKVVRVSVGLPRKATRAVRFRYATGALTAGSTDYTATSGTARIRKGARGATIAIRVVGDRLAEADERFVVRLARPVGARIARRAAKATVTINDDDKALVTQRPKPTPYSIGFNDAIGGELEPTVAVHAPAVSEPSTAGSASPHGAAIRLDRKSALPVTVSYTVAAQTATMPADVDIPNGAVTFAPGETEKVLPGTVKGDALDEDDETVRIVLSDAKGAKIAQPTGTLAITDAAEDVPPAASVGDASYDETAGTKDLVVPVTLGSASGKPVTVRVKTQNGTAKAGAGLDYEALDTTLTFLPGQTAKHVLVRVHDDLRDEDVQTFDVGLSEPVNADIADATGTVTIADDDAAPSLSVGDLLRLENATVATFDVNVSTASDKQITVGFATLNGSASAGSCAGGGDYVAKSTSLIIAPGSTKASVGVTICEDNVFEMDETFNVVLSNVTNASLSDPNATLTIQNDD